MESSLQTTWIFQPQSYSLDVRPKGANEQGVVLVRRFGIKWQKNQDVCDERLAKLQNKEQKEEKESHISADDLIFADIKCILDSSNTFIPILICYTKGDSDKIFYHWGTNCVQLFIKTMLRWVKENKKEGKPYHFTIFLHNLKGFDGVFIIDALYKTNLKVTDIMATGTKMLHFKHKHVTFKDSLCFLNMPLTNFTKTFGLKELKIGWFPHKFSKLENLDYEGPIPSLQFF